MEFAVEVREGQRLPYQTKRVVVRPRNTAEELFSDISTGSWAVQYVAGLSMICSLVGET
jgi:hypothetical protein